MAELKSIIEDSFIQYSGAVLQSRALVDVRDCLKPSARQIFYSMRNHKLTYKNPHKKTANAVGMAMADYYIHGDSSCTGIIMRAGQNFAMRYPLVDVKGNMGSLIESGNYAAPRYTESRLSAISEVLFQDIEKETISEWRDSYDNTQQYPAVLPSKGFYGIVNGTLGIGIGMASSIPQHNLREVNNALITLLWNPDCSFEDIYCAPDFATGAILLNEDEVKESLKNGQGKACKLRSVIEYDKKERVFTVVEIPYGVYTNTICGQLEEILNSDENPGIDRFNDLTGATPNLKIYLNKNANPDRILRYLYKNTSLQSHYGINLTMLDNGRYPKIFTWKEALQAHLTHEAEVYRRSFEFDLRKLSSRRHILEGYLICLARIDEVVQTIKKSATTTIAKSNLVKEYLLDDDQATAVLKLTLSRLAHLEIEKIEKELLEIVKEIERITAILGDEILLKKEIEKGLRAVAENFGDERRTKILNLQETNNDEPIEEKQLSISFTNEGAIYVSETSTLYTQKKNGVGSKFKLDKGEYIVDNLIGKNIDEILFFTNYGNCYHAKMSSFSIGEKQYLNNFITLRSKENICAATIISKNNSKQYIIFITKNGLIKKSLLSEYNLKRSTGALAINLDQSDKIVSILFTNEDNIGILSKKGYFICIGTNDIRPIGRVARGVVGMKLNEDDEVVSAHIIDSSTKELMSITEDGHSKRSDISEFRLTGRATKGVKIQKADNLCDFLPINNNSDILVVSTESQIRVKLEEISSLSRGALGTKTIKLNNTSKVIALSKF